MTNDFDDFFGLGEPKPFEPLREGSRLKQVIREIHEKEEEEIANKEIPKPKDTVLDEMAKHNEKYEETMAQLRSMVTKSDAKPIDRYGKCPNPECGEEWDMGDILVNLRSIEAFAYKSEEELVNIAAHGFGYQKSNPKNFSKVIAIQVIEDTVHASQDINPNRNVVDPHFYMCPKCRRVWDADTGQQYGSIMQAKKLRGFNDEYNSRESDQAHQE